ncbi:MAG: glycosyltransferase [Clostridia bacterium]|nr:glycosyltransferase [Clostridia bacterium]
MAEDKEKFCIFVPCHNEGSVIKATVLNYAAINYDENLFDIYFIADNCADNTADEIKRAIEEVGCANFHILERSEKDPRKNGKPHALRWAISMLESGDGFYDKYDMLMILDADNFVDADILKHINSQYLSYKPKKRPTMIQTYLDCKNNRGLVAKGYFASYRITGTFWHTAKQKLRLVPAIGGTGYAVTTEFLKSIGGFNCTSLTEDLEIQTKATIKNKIIVYNRNVRIYDEKPTKIKQSFVQRTRWAQGHWYLFFKFVPLLFLQLFNLKTIKATFRKIDMMIYLMSKLLIICATLASALVVFFFFYDRSIKLIPDYFGILGYFLLAVSLLVIPLSSLYDGTKKEKRRVLIDFIPNYISMMVVSIIDTLAIFVGLFKCGNQRVWKKTAHKITEMNTDDTEGQNASVQPVLPSNIMSADKDTKEHRTA